MSIEFVVITSVPDILDPEAGNLCDDFIYPFYDEVNRQNTSVVGISDIPASKPSGMVKTPVFYPLEIVICDSEYGREIDGKERNPSKWYVGTETFSDLDEAIKRVIELKQERNKL